MRNAVFSSRHEGDAALPANPTAFFAVGALFGFFMGQAITVPAASAAEGATSAWQGVFTKDQAARGKTRYFAACASCHGGLLQGDSDSPELAGTAFMKRWGDQPVGTLFAFAMSQMPVGRPGSLGAQGYVDVIAYILATNGFPDGKQELPTNALELESIIIEKKR